MDFPGVGEVMPMIGTADFDERRAFGTGAPTSVVWPTADLAMYIPRRTRHPYLIRKMWCANGTVVNGNVDIGIYTATGDLLTSTGSTAQAGTSAVQFIDCTDVLLTPGVYYFALASSSGTATFQRAIPTINALLAMGAAQEASAFPLPAAATFATATNDYLPIFGGTNRTIL